MKTQLVIDYNATRNGVDVPDQMSFYHTVFRKTKKWYRKVVFELLTGPRVVNAWILYNKLMPKVILIFQFKESFVENLREFNSLEILSDTDDTRTRNVQQVHAI